MKSIALSLTCFVITASLQAQTLVGNWQFNTPGDNEGWTAQDFTVNNLHVGAAVSGSETVLTSDNLKNQNDAKIYFPDTYLELPGGSPGWDEYVIRIRQIGTDGTTPVAFNNAGTFAMLGTTPWGTLFFVNGTTGTGGTVPVSQVTEAGEWNVFTFDLSAYTSGTVSGKARLDPVTGTVSGSDILGNFEIDYVTISAMVPEPRTYALMVGVVILGMSIYWRRNRAC